jgi:hypothetical protein
MRVPANAARHLMNLLGYQKMWFYQSQQLFFQEGSARQQS